MVTITVQETKLQVSGKTYAHKETIKNLGGRWNPDQRVWEVPNTQDNLSILKGLKQKRNCGYCGCPGHFRPKCEAWREDQRILALHKAAKRENPGWHYKEVFQGKGRLRVQNSGPPYRTSRHNGPGTVYMLGVPTLLLFLSGSVRKATWLLPFREKLQMPDTPKDIPGART